MRSSEVVFAQSLSCFASSLDRALSGYLARNFSGGISFLPTISPMPSNLATNFAFERSGNLSIRSFSLALSLDDSLLWHPKQDLSRMLLILSGIMNFSSGAEFKESA